jgi:hypothetical protein
VGYLLDGDDDGRARSHCRSAPPRTHFIPVSLSIFGISFLIRRCDRTQDDGDGVDGEHGAEDAPAATESVRFSNVPK